MRVRFGKSNYKRLESELKTAQRLNNLRLYKISKAMLMIADEYRISTIAEILNVSTRTIFYWLSKFLAERFSWLLGYHYRGRGRHSKLTRNQKQKLYQIVDQGPEKYGFDCGVWTSAMIAEVILREFNVTYNPRYLCSLLKKIGLSYQKAAFVSDHLDEEKRKHWVEVTWPAILKQAQEKNAVILFCDEVSFAQWGSLSRTWAPKGKQPKIKTTGIRKGLKMFGAIEFFDGDFHFMETAGRFNGQSYSQFLKHLLNRYNRPIILIEDGARYHGGKIVNPIKEKYKDDGRLFVYRLPSYSPDYNPIEKLWKNTKKDATHCKYFPTFEDLRASVIKAFEKYLQDAKKVICVMKKLRANAGVV
jgi:transposase